jgi:hypothetical protein
MSQSLPPPPPVLPPNLSISQSPRQEKKTENKTPSENILPPPPPVLPPNLLTSQSPRQERKTENTTPSENILPPPPPVLPPNLSISQSPRQEKKTENTTPSENILPPPPPVLPPNLLTSQSPRQERKTENVSPPRQRSMIGVGDDYKGNNRDEKKNVNRQAKKRENQYLLEAKYFVLQSRKMIDTIFNMNKHLELLNEKITEEYKKYRNAEGYKNDDNKRKAFYHTVLDAIEIVGEIKEKTDEIVKKTKNDQEKIRKKINLSNFLSKNKNISQSDEFMVKKVCLLDVAKIDQVKNINHNIGEMLSYLYFLKNRISTSTRRK